MGKVYLISYEQYVVTCVVLGSLHCATGGQTFLPNHSDSGRPRYGPSYYLYWMYLTKEVNCIVGRECQSVEAA